MQLYEIMVPIITTRISSRTKQQKKKEKRKKENLNSRKLTRVGKLFLQSIKTTLVKKHLLKRCHSNYLNPSIFLVPYPPIFILTV